MLHYWWTVVVRALADSLEVIGHPAITIPFGLCVLVLTALIAWRREQSTWQGWDVFIRTRLIRDLAWGIPIVILAWIPFFAWFAIYTPYKMQMESEIKERTSYATRDDIQKKLDLFKVPNITGEIQSLSIGTPSRHPNDTLVVVGVHLRNLGAPTILDGIRLEAVTSDGRKLVAFPYSYGHGIAQENGPTGGAFGKFQFNYDSEYYLARRVSETPIPTDGGASGWIDGIFSGIKQNEMKHGLIMLNFKDINGKPYSIDHREGDAFP